MESQLIERSSVLTRLYTTNLALYIVGVLKKYHAVLILSDTDVHCVWDSLVNISYRVPVPQESPRLRDYNYYPKLPMQNLTSYCINE